MCDRISLNEPTSEKVRTKGPYINYPPPCRKAPLRAQAHAEGTSHYLQSSSSSSHPVLFAVGVWRSSWSWSLQFQLKSESGVPSLETSKGGPPSLRARAWIATPLRLPISLSGRPFSPSCLILALLAAILAHLGALRPHLVAKLLQDGAQMAQHSAKMRQHRLREDPQIQKNLQK